MENVTNEEKVSVARPATGRRSYTITSLFYEI